MAKLGIIAGLGGLPVSIAQAAEADGRPFHVFRLAGFEEPRLEAFPCETVGIGQIGKLVKRLKAEACEDVVLAGIVKRPDFKDIRLDMRGARLLPRVVKAARNGDDALLRVIISELEQEGFHVIAAEDAAGALKSGSGHLNGPAPDEGAIADLKKAAGIASEMGRLDIGQGCVVCDGLVLAVEAQEGTDRMLERVAALEPEIRGTSSRRRGVLVKRPKPIQERRIDLPTIGAGTIEKAAACGLAGIGVEAGGALLLDKARIEALCDELGVFLYGFPPDWS
ncbi:LpxI family protein [Henriciella aquimarina]|uniref:LpxI family protein n=1 Tax=Henriciella aquimarina TaxID=545261 RepID=UPI000A07988B|nr:UDP-2,3-diacylglucosamine diphosphatase LpxI [Henriciella aquimarina]